MLFSWIPSQVLKKVQERFEAGRRMHAVWHDLSVQTLDGQPRGDLLVDVLGVRACSEAKVMLEHDRVGKLLFSQNYWP